MRKPDKLFRMNGLVFGLTCSLLGCASSSVHPTVLGSDVAPGTIVVKTNERRLYFVLDNEKAMRFPVGVGKAGMTWSGKARVEGKYIRPAWAAPPATRVKS